MFKGELKSERSLSFIEVGHKPDSGGEANAGCAQVKRIVSSLSERGNESVFGLVDWDGETEESARIKVLSAGIRNGLETAIFDPVILLATCVRENITYCRGQRFLDPEDTYMNVLGWNTEQWQVAVDKLQEQVIGECEENEELSEIEYLGGLRLKIRDIYLHLDDHALETKIIDTFGFLKPKNKRAGGLINHVIETVLADCPDILPKDVLDTFLKILEE